MIRRSSTLLVLLVLSGCSIFTPPQTLPPPPPPELPPIVEPDPDLVPAPQPDPVVVAPDPEPEPDVVPPNIQPLVAIVISDQTPAYTEVSEALESHLDNHVVYDLSARGLPARDAFAKIAESGASAVVAIGLPAARAARRFATVPVVVGQVFNVTDGDLLSDDVRAVAVLPPISLQMDAWHRLDPSVRNVGAILGEGHEELIAEADEALKARGVKFHYAIATSDRETLYLFNRLVRDIDGFILFPDNRILSRGVLVEMMNYASRHRVQVAVFNEPLLEYGALFSAGAPESDIAGRITIVLDKILSGKIDSVPTLTPLTEIEVLPNPQAMQRMGLEAPVDALDHKVAEVQ
jgi:ABC-type uncharacterized transport system substrate-binding protein